MLLLLPQLNMSFMVKKKHTCLPFSVSLYIVIVHFSPPPNRNSSPFQILYKSTFSYQIQFCSKIWYILLLMDFSVRRDLKGHKWLKCFSAYICIWEMLLYSPFHLHVAYSGQELAKWIPGPSRQPAGSLRKIWMDIILWGPLCSLIHRLEIQAKEAVGYRVCWGVR